MPRWASRITLEVTEVRVERVQEITEAGAASEGVGHLLADGLPAPQAKSLTEALMESRACAFGWLWDSIYAAKGLGWLDNPWVWVVKFKVVSS
jgi:hypothetical protein